MKKLIVGLIVGLCIVAVGIGLFFPAGGSGSAGGLGKPNTIAVVRIEGTISGGDSGGSLLGGSAVGADTINEQLREIAKDKSIKAVVLRLDTPGGAASAGEEISMSVDAVKKSGKVVVASMGDMAASAGYMIAAHADRIVANNSTMTGSIGVIMSMQNLQGLYDKIGYKDVTIKSGPYKDIGNAARPMTDTEHQMLQGMVNDIFSQFVDTVAHGRHMSRQTVLKYATGEIFTGRQAKKIGLVDDIGTYYDALDIAAKMAKMKPDSYEVKDYSKETGLGYLLGSESKINKNVLNQLLVTYLASQSQAGNVQPVMQ